MKQSKIKFYFEVTLFRYIKTIFIAVFLISFGNLKAQQQKDTANPFANAMPEDSLPVRIAVKNFKTKLLPSMIIPAALIGYGLTTFGNHGLYSNISARDDIQRAFGNKRAPIDDYLILAPYVEFGVLLLLKQKCRNDAVNTLLLIAKSEAIMLAIVFPLKYATHVQRPDSSNSQSFPSGHTAEAFVAATIVYREYRYSNPWYGVGAYVLATTVAAYRMINNKHWQSDVLVGAGIGIFSANLVFATHLNRWGRKDVCIVPVVDSKNKGFAMSYKF